MSRFSLRQIVTALSYVLMLAVTSGSFGSFDNSQSIENISGRTNEALILPPDFTFFIVWGVIYFLIGGFVTYQLRPDQRDNPIINRIGYWFAFNMVINAGWILATQAENFVLNNILLFGLFATLLIIQIRARIGLTAVKTLDRWLVQIPFSTYFAWLSVALIVSASEILIDAGWNGFGIAAETWTIIMMAVAAALAIILLIIRRNVPFVLVVMWALFGIAIKQQTINPAIFNGAIVLEIVLAVALLIITLPRLNNPDQGVSLLNRTPITN